eukprot:EG_transcript_7453
MEAHGLANLPLDLRCLISRFVPTADLPNWALACKAALTSVADWPCLSATDDGIDHLGPLVGATLRSFAPHGPALTGRGLYTLAQWATGLRRVALGGCTPLPADALAALAAGCPRLATLELPDCVGLDDPTLLCFARHCPQLTALDVSGCYNATGAGGVGPLAAACRGLRQLRMQRLRGVTPEVLQQLAVSCPTLTILDVSGCLQVDDAGLNPLITKCDISSLTIAGCPKVTDATLASLADHRAGLLRRLDVTACPAVSGAGVARLLRCCPSVTSLGVGGVDLPAGLQIPAAWPPTLLDLTAARCGGVSDPVVAALARGCPRLQRLDLSYCKDITDEGLAEVAAGCPDLQGLVLEGCPCVTDDSIQGLLLRCPALDSLNLARCKRVGDATLAAIIAHRPTIKHLNVSRCHRMTEHCLQVLMTACEALQHLDALDR